MVFLVLKLSVWLGLAVGLGWLLRGYWFGRRFLEVSDGEMTELQSKIARLESENAEARGELITQTERARSLESQLEGQRESLRALEQKKAELQALVDEGDGRVNSALKPVQQAHDALAHELAKRTEEVKALQSRLNHADTMIKRKTELLRLSETDPAKAAKLSWRPPDSSRPSQISPATGSSPGASVAPSALGRSIPPGAPSSVPPRISSHPGGPPAPTRWVPSGAPPSGALRTSSVPPAVHTATPPPPSARPSALPPRPPSRASRPPPPVAPALQEAPDRGPVDPVQRVSGVDAEVEEPSV